jgi:hypothetical protein
MNLLKKEEFAIYMYVLLYISDIFYLENIVQTAKDVKKNK